ncbi:MAG: hypothetical protein OHK006_00330 [Thermodesulfovibrionales bacterium]
MRMKQQSGFKTLVSFTAVLLLICMPATVFGGTIVVKPGQFDHFAIQVPDRAVAGENLVIRVQAYDANKNLITNFAETGKEFKVEVSGSATAQPAVIGQAAFAGGVANITINDRKAEKIVFSLRESGGTVPVVSRDIVFQPNKLDHFQIQAPKSAVAGTSFDVKIVARDLYDNTVLDSDIGRGIKIMSTGSSSVKLVGGAALDFKNGSSNAVFVAEKTGDVAIEIQETGSGSSGKTGPISVTPAALGLFKLQAPRSAVAGEPFEMLITAYDLYDNIATNYASSGSGVRITSTGSSKVEPSSVSASEFKNGQATVRVTYEKAEDIQLIVRENGREQTGKTAEISVGNAGPEHFVVITPDSAVSGQKFKLRVEAYDRFKNLVKNFNLIGADVLLNTTGNGTLTPSHVSAAEFTNGVAVVEAVYDKAESFQVSASFASDKPRAKMTVREETRKEVGVAPKKETKKEKPAAEAKPAPEKKPSSAKKETNGKKAAPAEEPRKSASAEKSAEKALVKQTKAELQKETKPAPKPEPKPETAKPVEAPKKPAAEIAQKPAEKKSDKPSIYTISNVSVVESKNKAMLVINVTNPNGTLEFSDEIESRLGKEWLKLKVRPAVNAAGKSFKFQSAFVRDVVVEEDKNTPNTIYLLVELLPAGLTYDIARVKNSLIVTFANP